MMASQLPSSLSIACAYFGDTLVLVSSMASFFPVVFWVRDYTVKWNFIWIRIWCVVFLMLIFIIAAVAFW